MKFLLILFLLLSFLFNRRSEAVITKRTGNMGGSVLWKEEENRVEKHREILHERKIFNA